MDVGLGIAGLICVAMGFGHASLGLVWVLPGLSEEDLPKTPFGPQSMTEAMIRVAWHVVTVFALGVGAILMTLAWAPGSDAQTLLLRWLAVMWLAATAMAVGVVGRGGLTLRSLRNFLRLPVPLLWVVVAVLCWQAST